MNTVKRQIITIDEDKCNGCELCVNACHEGAIGMVNGKAKLLRDDYCDGLGDCLPTCPTGAISFIEKETAPYVKPDNPDKPNKLSHWPVQIKLVPINAPYFDNANLLIAADCTAYACADFHNEFMKNRITIIGCPKLDAIDYSEKLTEIIKKNNINSLTVVRMEVPCCGGIEFAVKKALQDSGKTIPCKIITVGIDGTRI